MKTFPVLSVVIVGLLLVACGGDEKQQKQQAGAPATYERPVLERPAAIPPELAVSAYSSVDQLNDQPAQPSNSIADKSKVKIVGWAAEVPDGTVAKEVWLEFVAKKSAYVKVNTLGLERPDVAKAFSKPTLTNSGWVVFADLSALEPDDYTVRIIMLCGDNYSVRDSKRVLKIN